jgi:hypothetical protein
MEKGCLAHAVCARLETCCRRSRPEGLEGGEKWRKKIVEKACALARTLARSAYLSKNGVSELEVGTSPASAHSLALVRSEAVGNGGSEKWAEIRIEICGK